MKKTNMFGASTTAPLIPKGKLAPKSGRFTIALEFAVAFVYTALYKFLSWIPIFRYLVKILPDPNQAIPEDLAPLNITTDSSLVMKSAAETQVHNMRTGIIDVGFKPTSLPMEPENREAREFTKSFFSSAILKVRRIVSKSNVSGPASISKEESPEQSLEGSLELLSYPRDTLPIKEDTEIGAAADSSQKAQNRNQPLVVAQYNASKINTSPFVSTAPILRFLGLERQSHVPRPRISPMKTLEKKYLVLDLDETLIHSSPHSSYKAHLRIEVIIEKMACLYYIYKRPYVDYFLRKVSEWYKIVIFTASIPEYANPVLNFLDPFDSLFHRRLFRDSCMLHNLSYTKDLKIVSENLSQVLLVDNSPISYFINQENAIPISSWTNSDPKDESLLDLLPFLDAMRFTDDVRSILSLRML